MPTGKPRMWWPGINRRDPLTWGLVGWWPLWEGEGLSVGDPVGYGGSGTLLYMPANPWRGGNLYFDGSQTNIVDIANEPKFRHNQLTAIAKFYQTGAKQDYRSVVSKEDGSWTLRTAVGNVEFYFRRVTAGGWIGVTYSPYSLNTWHTLAVTYDQVTIRLYLDGVERDTQAETDTIYQGDPNSVKIGGTDFARNRPFEGYIEYAGLWNRALSANEITQITMNPYLFSRPAPIARRHVAAVGGLSIPVAMHHYMHTIGSR